MSRKTQDWRCYCSGFVLLSSVLIASFQDSVFAQITPDGTLPNNSNVARDGNTFNITGGTTAGSNLFHSFEEFSVPTNGTASFNNAVDIQNIISRVTGGSVSDINGLIKANGTANLFLINPSGIVFGENASLDIGGSFVGSTADAIGFGENNFFSASSPENSSSLLEVSPSALFFNQVKAASIQSNSVADAGFNANDAFNASGLRVPNGKSLLLVGGDININDGALYAFGGRVELGGLSAAGTVGLNGNRNNLSLTFPTSVDRSNVSLSNRAIVGVIADDGGSIAINARNFKLSGRSLLIAGIESGLGSDDSRAGNIDINVTNEINNNGSYIFNAVSSEANGQAGNVNINANTLLVQGGAQVSASAVGDANGGNLTVNASDVQLIGAGGGLFVSAGRNSKGNAGNLKIKTSTLRVQDGAQANASTVGEGNGGNLTVNASDVQLIGAGGGLFVSARRNSKGNAGNLKIKTSTLLVQDGAKVSAGTFGAGNGGNLTIKTSTLQMQDGAQLSVSTFGEGKGGNLTVDAEDIQLIGASKNGQLASGLFAKANLDSTEDAGELKIKTSTLLIQDGARVSTTTSSKGKGGDLTVYAEDVQLVGINENGQFVSGLFASADEDSTGEAGNLKIKTSTLRVQDGAQVSAGTFGAGNGGNLIINAKDVQLFGRSKNGLFGSGLFTQTESTSEGDAGDLTVQTNTLLVQDWAVISVRGLTTEGTAGKLTINADFIRLNKNAFLSASTSSNKIDPKREQATININSQDLIMRRNSNIFTNARGENVVAGNINIATDFLIANENSDISADSANSQGGNVQIDAEDILGTQFRPQLTPQSDITATGASSDLRGTVELNTPEVDPNNGLVELPTIPVDTEVAQGCYSPGYAQSSFVIAGDGGLPPNPKDILTPNTTQIDWVSVKPSNNNRSLQPVTTKPTSAPKRIVEATGATLNAKGQIVLAANPSTVTSNNISKNNSISCQNKLKKEN